MLKQLTLLALLWQLSASSLCLCLCLCICVCDAMLCRQCRDSRTSKPNAKCRPCSKQPKLKATEKSKRSRRNFAAIIAANLPLSRGYQIISSANFDSLKTKLNTTWNTQSSCFSVCRAKHWISLSYCVEAERWLLLNCRRDDDDDHDDSQISLPLVVCESNVDFLTTTHLIVVVVVRFEGRRAKNYHRHSEHLAEFFSILLLIPKNCNQRVLELLVCLLRHWDFYLIAANGLHLRTIETILGLCVS